MNQRSIVAGFSLIEVTIALGLTTFALMAVVAAMPAGLNTLRSAMNDTLEARMIQRVAAELQMSDFANIGDSSYYFDAEGEPLSSAAGASYRLDSVNLNAGTDIFPGAPSGIQNDLFSVGITIYREDAKPNPVRISSFPVAVARGG